jgi:hypothetical protein
MARGKDAPAAVDAYLAGLPVDSGEVLEELRQLIKKPFRVSGSESPTAHW